jgi:hypothetical protein
VKLKIDNLPAIILKAGLPVIAAAMLYIYITIYTADSNYVTTVRQASAMIEHVLMSLTLIIGGAFLANTISER